MPNAMRNWREERTLPDGSVEYSCNRCGAIVEEWHRFCHGCGRKLNPKEAMLRLVESEERKRRIADALRLGGLTQREIAEYFGVSASYVSYINTERKYGRM